MYIADNNASYIHSSSSCIDLLQSSRKLYSSNFDILKRVYRSRFCFLSIRYRLLRSQGMFWASQETLFSFSARTLRMESPICILSRIVTFIVRNLNHHKKDDHNYFLCRQARMDDLNNFHFETILNKMTYRRS